MVCWFVLFEFWVLGLVFCIGVFGFPLYGFNGLQCDVGFVVCLGGWLVIVMCCWVWGVCVVIIAFCFYVITRCWCLFGMV